MSVESHTIIDPWAVVIHVSNASIARVAVMGMRRLDRIALEAFLGEDLVYIGVSLYSKLLFSLI